MNCIGTEKSLSLDLLKKHLQEQLRAVILLWDTEDVYKCLPALFYLIVWFLRKHAKFGLL